MSTWKTPKGTELPLLNMRGKPYLQVAHRLVWFREECPEHTIETEYVTFNDNSAFARAVIKDPQGRVLATAHKYEDERGFPDFREKAETGAVGRALAMIGYGTQFCADELDEGERLADSPMPPARIVARDMQPPPGDGIQEAGVEIKYGPLAKQLVHKADPARLRSYLLEEKSKWDYRKLPAPPPWAVPMVQEAERVHGIKLY